MPDSVPLPGYQWFRAFRNAPVRLGIYTGVCLSIIFIAWLIVANRAALLAPFALERNVAAAAAIVFVAAIPVLRFLRSPRSLVLAGLICWSMFSFVYRILCLFFSALSDWHSTTQVLMIGIVMYLIASTLSWLAMVIRRIRRDDAAHFRNHMS
jgi:hypothetical protein